MDVILTLYIAGHTARSRDAVKSMRRIVSMVGEGVNLSVVDVLDSPGLAERERIVATPMVVRESPEPVLRLVGDLTAWERVMRELELKEEEDSNE